MQTFGHQRQVVRMLFLLLVTKKFVPGICFKIKIQLTNFLEHQQRREKFIVKNDNIEIPNPKN